MDCSPPDSSVHGILPSLGDLLHTGVELMSLMSPALAGEFFTASATQEALVLGLVKTHPF